MRPHCCLSIGKRVDSTCEINDVVVNLTTLKQAGACSCGKNAFLFSDDLDLEFSCVDLLLEIEMNHSLDMVLRQQDALSLQF